MKLLSFFTRAATAPVARERLQLLLAHERAAYGRSELLEMLRTEILQVIAKHVAVDNDKVKVIVGNLDGVATLEVDIEIRAPSDVPLDKVVRKVA
ncbi:MAG: minE [Microvirga sp.]|jgi:cell division topological specificity factor|nr:minE [Microvirga sp.]